MKNTDITTWDKLLDFLDMCDSDGTLIYATLPTMTVPIDNFEFMKIASSKDLEAETFLSIEEDEFGNLFLV